MKKLLATLTPCIIICLLISSCSSNVSIVKRHYRGGYYVNYVKKTPAATPVANAKTTPRQRVVVTALPSPQIQADNKESFNLNTTPVPVSTTAVSENSYHKNVKSIAKQLTAPLTNIAKAPATEVKQSLSEGIDGSAGHDGDAAGAALSLLWIIIVIILIVWLVGILAGGWAGGLLDLLLVIALILLILWLLRIA